MIYKSFLVEENIKILKNNITLLYGENLGLINDIKETFKNFYKNSDIIKLSEEEVLKNQNFIFNEITNYSLFGASKIIFISETTDKILENIKDIEPHIGDNKIFLIGGLLNKNSKLRSHFEKSQSCNIVPCYQDNQLSIKKIINKKLINYKGVTPQVINLLLEICGEDRLKIINEITKIKTFFEDKTIDINKLEKILNEKIDNNFNVVKDNALSGNKNITNKLLSSTIFEIEKITYYISAINQRLSKIKEVIDLSREKKIVDILNNMKPPIFWKDKPIFLEQTKMWNSEKIKLAINKTYNVENIIKSNSIISKEILVKKLLLDICNLANS